MKSPSPESVKLLVTTVQELSLARSLQSVMNIVRTAARQLTGADGATFVLKDGDRCYYAEEDAISPLWKGSRFPIDTCISGWAMLNRQPAIIEDIYADNRIPADAYRPTFVKSLAMVPIRTIDPIGAIGNYWAKPHLPTEEEVMLLQSLADITAVTIENVNIYAELEQRVKERTLQLEAINKDLEDFSYSVSHDLRTPLRSIKIFTEILLEDHGKSLNDEGRMIIGKILRGSDETSQLIDQLLAFFKWDKTALSKAAVPMNSMVAAITEELTTHEKGRKIEFCIHNMPDAVADPSLVKQVWSNLISNAIKYTGKKEKAVIEIGSNQNEPDGHVYYVKDNGAGFDMRYYDKLFGMFHRLHSHEEFNGTGIGLATVQRIVQRHGGRIWADAKPGKGATFYYSLPQS